MHSLNFDSFGHLTPYNIIEVNMQIMEKEFVTNFPNSHTRQEIWEGYKSYLQDFQEKIDVNFSQWIDGSFITKKLNPNDMDIVTFISYKTFDDKRAELLQFKGDEAINKYKVDAYFIVIYPENHKKHSLFLLDTLQFREDWGNTLKNKRGIRRKKGIIQISYK